VAPIYVQIPAYRDPELSATLLDLYRTADSSEDLRVCVLWQRAEDETLDEATTALPNLELLELSYRESQGCNWARRLLQDRWKGEPYSLLLDSHHRFAVGWDTQLIALYEECRSRSTEPLLTAYLPSYDPALEPIGRYQKPHKTYAYERESGVLTRLTSHPIPFWERLTCPIEGDYVSLHFLFVAGDFNERVRFDPDIYYCRDEVMTSVQAYTHGYDFFHPHRVIGWHCYDQATRRPHFCDHADWHVRQPEALEKMRQTFLGHRPERLGTARTVRDFERHVMGSLVSER
jgi:hypothetical protein